MAAANRWRVSQIIPPGYGTVFSGYYIVFEKEIESDALELLPTINIRLVVFL